MNIRKFYATLIVFCMILCMTAVAEESWICPACGASVSGNFCNYCGEAKPSEEWICPNCKKTVQGNFCSNCGTAKPTKTLSTNTEDCSLTEYTLFAMSYMVPSAWKVETGENSYTYYGINTDNSISSRCNVVGYKTSPEIIDKINNRRVDDTFSNFFKRVFKKDGEISFDIKEQSGNWISTYSDINPDGIYFNLLLTIGIDYSYSILYSHNGVNRKDQDNEFNKIVNTIKFDSKTNDSNALQGVDPLVNNSPTEEPNKQYKKGEVEYETKIDFELKDRGGYYGSTAIVEVTNTGVVPIYLDSSVFDFEDNDGHLLKTENFIYRFPDVVFPGDKGYYFQTISLSDVDATNGISFVPNLNIRKATNTLKRHEVDDITLFANSLGNVGLRGRIVNESNKEIPNIYVELILFDNEGKVLAFDGVNVTGIPANSKKSFEISANSYLVECREFTIDDVSSYKIYADEMYLQW